MKACFFVDVHQLHMESYIIYSISNHVFVFQVMVLLQCAGCNAWEDTENQCDEHEQPEEALQPGNGSSCTDFTWQEPVGKGPGQTRV